MMIFFPSAIIPSTSRRVKIASLRDMGPKELSRAIVGQLQILEQEKSDDVAIGRCEMMGTGVGFRYV